MIAALLWGCEHLASQSPVRVPVEDARGPLPEAAPVGKEIGAVVGAVVVMGVVTMIQDWLGVPA